MHDEEFQKCFQKDMSLYTLEDAEEFCEKSEIHKSLKDGACLHFAIANEEDEYIGTISLKNIDLKNKNAEYAISTRKKIHGKGVAKKATQMILYKAFHEYGLHRVYLNVLDENQAAIRLYEHSGFVYEGEFKQHLWIRGKYMNLRWYAMLKEEFDPNA
jgi:diamine N-acetyltransferase